MGEDCLTYHGIINLTSEQTHAYFHGMVASKGTPFVACKLNLFQRACYRYKRFHCTCCSCGRNCRPCFTEAMKQEMIDLLFCMLIIEQDMNERTKIIQEITSVTAETTDLKCTTTI